MSIKFGIIGFGKMGKIRKNAIESLKVGEVVGISEPNLDENLKIPNLSHDEIINNDKIDAIIICTPNYLNKDLTIKSLKANKHVFCEKPPAFTANDIKEIIKYEKINSDRKLMYGFNHRHHDSIIKMKEIIISNKLGKLIWMRGRYGKSVTKDYFNEWRADKKLSGGGILIDQGIHMLDLFLHFGSDFDIIKADVTNNYWNSDIEDNAFVILKNSKSGLSAAFHSTMTQWRHLFSIELFMEKGYMVLNGLITSTMSYGEEVLTIAKNRSTAPAATWKDENHIKYTIDNSWDNEIKMFSDSIINNKNILTGNSNDALKLMKIIDSIYSQKDF